MGGRTLTHAKTAPVENRERRGTLVVLAGILALGAWPYAGFLGTWPTSRDATIWITRGAPTSPGWIQWDLATQHFNVGYRPLTALSYSFDHLVGGFAAWPYRVTDLALHLACGLLVYLVYRRYASALPRWGGLVAAGLFMAHPLTEEVVPHLARRSYSLAAFLSLLALYMLCPRRPGEPSRPRSIVGGLALAGAVLSNEVALVTVAVVPLLLLGRVGTDTGRWRRLLRACALPAFFVLGALVARSVVVDGVGGYPARPDRAARAVPIALATGRALGVVNPAADDEDGGASVATMVVGSLLLAYYLSRSVAGWFRGGHADGGKLGGHLLVWIAGYAMLFAFLGVWFPRQVYVILAPFALLVAVLLAGTVLRYRSDRRMLAAHLAPQILLLGWVMVHSPSIRGVDPVLRACWERTDSLLRGMHRSLQDLSAPATVRLAIPHYRRPQVYAFRARDRTGLPPLGGHQPALWMNALLAGRGLTIESLALFEIDPLATDERASYTRSGGVPTVVLPEDAGLHLLGPGGTVGTEDSAQFLRIDPRVESTGTSFLYFHDGERGSTIELAGIEPAADPHDSGTEG